jgi:hypothetical protein
MNWTLAGRASAWAHSFWALAFNMDFLAVCFHFGPERKGYQIWLHRLSLWILRTCSRRHGTGWLTRTKTEMALSRFPRLASFLDSSAYLMMHETTLFRLHRTALFRMGLHPLLTCSTKRRCLEQFLFSPIVRRLFAPDFLFPLHLLPLLQNLILLPLDLLLPITYGVNQNSQMKIPSNFLLLPQTFLKQDYHMEMHF